MLEVSEYRDCGQASGATQRPRLMAMRGRASVSRRFPAAASTDNSTREWRIADPVEYAAPGAAKCTGAPGRFGNGAVDRARCGELRRV
jgi:hypothetical protein